MEHIQKWQNQPQNFSLVPILGSARPLPDARSAAVPTLSHANPHADGSTKGARSVLRARLLWHRWSIGTSQLIDQVSQPFKGLSKPK